MRASRFDGWTWRVVDTWRVHGALWTVRYFVALGIPASAVLAHMRRSVMEVKHG